MDGSPRLDLTESMVRFVAEMLNDGKTWKAIGLEYGVAGPRIKAAYRRGSGKFFVNTDKQGGVQ